MVIKFQQRHLCPECSAKFDLVELHQHSAALSPDSQIKHWLTALHFYTPPNPPHPPRFHNRASDHQILILIPFSFSKNLPKDCCCGNRRENKCSDQSRARKNSECREGKTKGKCKKRRGAVKRDENEALRQIRGCVTASERLTKLSKCMESLYRSNTHRFMKDCVLDNIPRRELALFSLFSASARLFFVSCQGSLHKENPSCAHEKIYIYYYLIKFPACITFGSYLICGDNAQARPIKGIGKQIFRLEYQRCS